MSHQASQRRQADKINPDKRGKWLSLALPGPSTTMFGCIPTFWLTAGQISFCICSPLDSRRQEEVRSAMASYLERWLLGSTNSGLLKKPNADISTVLVTQAPVCFSLVTAVYAQSRTHLNIIFIKLTEVYSEVWLQPSLSWLGLGACVGFGSVMCCPVHPQSWSNLLWISSPAYFIVLGLALLPSDPEWDCS